MSIQSIGAWLAGSLACIATNAQTTGSSDATVAYWRFESATAGRAVSPDRAIEDASGNGNHLRTFDPGTAPMFVEAEHWKAVPQTRRANRIAIDNSAQPTRPFPTRDLFLSPENSRFDLITGELKRWTIEASINFKGDEGWQQRWQTFVGRDGYNVPKRDALHEDPLANLGFKKRGDTNCISIEAFDSAGVYVTVQSRVPVKPDVWYDVAAVSDGMTLKLYVKGPEDSEMVLQDSKPFIGALASGGQGWTVGRGCFAFNPTEQMFGVIDEVRISNAALLPDRFLATPSTADVPAEDAAVASTAPITRPADPFPTVPESLIHPHDPVLVRAGDSFHVLASHGGLVHWRSKDLVHWINVPPVMKSAPLWASDKIASDPGIWAPDVEFFNGKYHLYYSLSRFGSQRSAIALMTGESLDPENPKYGWKDEGPVVESSPGMDYNAIDPAVVLDADKQPWLAWGSFNKGIYLAKIDPASGKVVGEQTHIAARPGSTAIEAPDLFYREGYYYLIVSYDFCCRGARSTYKLVVGRSQQITGPYLSRDGKPMLDGEATLLIRSHDYWIGPGQSSVVEANGAFTLAHHYYDSRRNGEPTLAVRDLLFDDEGWPLLGEPFAEVREAPFASMVGRYRVQIDYIDAGEMEFGPNGTVTGSLGEGHYTDRAKAGELSLNMSANSVTKNVACVVSRDRTALVGRDAAGRIIRAVRADR